MTRGDGPLHNTSLGEIAQTGVDGKRGGYSRHVFEPAELDLREWFTEQARRRGLDVTVDRNGNMWAWWGDPGPEAVVTGSHLDSVPGGGAFDGPLGVVSALNAVDVLRAKGFQPHRPLAVVVFAEEEGGRFGVPCLGSRLLTGAIDADRALALADADGTTFADAAQGAGLQPRSIGRDPEQLARIGTFVELHVEQGRALDGLDYPAPVAVGSTIDPHGRWRLTFTGRGDHAGTAAIAERADPMLPAAQTVLAAREAARDGTRATVGRLVPVPGGTNVIPSRVDLWLDTRSGREPDTLAAVDEIVAAARRAAEAEGCAVEVRAESFSDEVAFDPVLRERISARLRRTWARGSGGPPASEGVAGGGGWEGHRGVPVLPTGAGHDAGVLAAHVPTAMLYVRNPTGVSHSPEEYAEDADCAAGVQALATVLEDLAGPARNEGHFRARN